MAVFCGAAKSKTDARNLIKQGGLTFIVDNFAKKITRQDEIITEEDLPRFLTVTVNGVDKKIWILPDGWVEQGKGK